MVVLPMSSRWSSLLEVTVCVPVMPPAPARLSITIDCPSLGPMISERIRTEPLPAPPGAKGTTTVMGFEGQEADCARVISGVKLAIVRAKTVRRVV